MHFDDSHLEFFKSCLGDKFPTQAGIPPLTWARYVLSDQLIAVPVPVPVPDVTLSRVNLFDLSANRTVTNRDFALSVLAWGGMNRAHGQMLFRDTKSWLDIVGSLRSGDFNSIDGYNKFMQLRQNGELPGMGPAYFTKLIFFASPKHDGFIMDQWTARSANLLLGRQLVDTITLNQRGSDRKAQRVSDRNDSGVYNEFCRFIFSLAREVGYEGREADVEEALFSQGRRRGCWRNYVLENDSHKDIA